MEDKYHYIGSLEELNKVAIYLQKFKCLAIDIENHSEYSYEGFISLIQITTPEYDTYLVDPLVLKDLIFECLGPIFINQNIVKIFHGGINSDVGWLQRDYGICVNNFIDTQEMHRKFVKVG